jgi:hypothetical protein
MNNRPARLRSNHDALSTFAAEALQDEISLHDTLRFIHAYDKGVEQELHSQKFRVIMRINQMLVLARE